MSWHTLIKRLASLLIVILTGALFLGLALLALYLLIAVLPTLGGAILVLAVCLLTGICIWTLLPQDFVDAFDERFHLN